MRLSYSYLKATIGSNLEALMAGHNPAPRPTMLHITMPVTTQPQGTTKPVPKNMEKMLPTNTPSTMPKTAPNRLIMSDSYKNWLLMLLRVPAFFAKVRFF